jgi:hypothetical protein
MGEAAISRTRDPKGRFLPTATATAEKAGPATVDETQTISSKPAPLQPPWQHTRDGLKLLAETGNSTANALYQRLEQIAEQGPGADAAARQLAGEIASIHAFLNGIDAVWEHRHPRLDAAEWHRLEQVGEVR